MPTKKIWIWDHAEKSYWHATVVRLYDRAGDLEKCMREFRDEQFQRVDYDGVVYWDGGTEKKSIQLLQNVLDHEERDNDKFIHVVFAKARWKPKYDWRVRP